MPPKKHHGSKTANPEKHHGSKTANPEKHRGLKTAKRGKSNSKEYKCESPKNEKWKPFPDDEILENQYGVSNYGRIISIKTGNIVHLQQKMGYIYFYACVEKTTKSFRVHRLVAKAFVENKDPDNNTVVNHLDGDKLNNNYKNLEWTTVGGNNQHAADNKLTKTTTRRIGKYVGTTLMEEYDTLTAASKANNIHMSRIVEACKGRREEVNGFTFKYLDNNPNEQVIDPVEEGFKQVKTFPNYWVSDKGQVYSKPFKKFMKLSKHKSGPVQIQLTKRNPKGKGQIKKTVFIHNLVAIYFLKKPKGNYNCIRHKDGNKENNDVKNLEWNHVAGINTNFDI